MFLDVFQERGLEDADIRFGNPNHCFFPLFAELQPVSVQVACVLYSIMWIGKFLNATLLTFYHAFNYKGL